MFKDLIYQQVLPPVLAAVGALLVGALTLFTVWLKQKATGLKGLNIVAQLWEVVVNLVAHAETVLRPQFAKAMEDGKLTPEEGAALKAAVLDIIKRQAPPELIKAARSLFGDMLDIVLSGMVERANSSMTVASEGSASSVTPAATPPDRPSNVNPT